jgi:uncharacterized protein (TIGR03083 family)
VAVCGSPSSTTIEPAARLVERRGRLGGHAPQQHSEHVRADSAALLAAVRAEPDARVPACPEWDRATLLRHVANVHAWVRAQLAAGPGEERTFRDAERPPDGNAIYDWFEAGAVALADGLATIDTDVDWPTWAGPQPGAWFPRRMAQETAVHRWDVVPTPLDADLAADGLDELLVSFLGFMPKERFAEVSGTIHLHATDEDLTEPCEWLLTLGPAGVTAEQVHAKADVALRGPASDLLLWAWNRVPLDRFEVLGDATLAARWPELVSV